MLTTNRHQFRSLSGCHKNSLVVVLLPVWNH
jgi:hypothetical protein